MGKKKRQVRADFRKNRNVRAREKNWERGVDPESDQLDAVAQHESVRGKGELTPPRTTASR